ncbi:LysR family transcriptional regulator [Azoarcus sp. TTM-91]|uniref:LysR family transcriptional regulator n=1 Tax=Azoarcus sp. TTM-91 TaxID=2691581 RepID=UPI00145C5B45|nr:LysR family transcriptional regulator [Azoarcus sp. TTM-91]
MRTNDWNDWYAFAAVAQLGSFTRAAEQLGLPKSSVSYAVARLERRLGQRLLERSTRRLALTEQGERLREQVAPLFERLDGVAAEAGDARDEARGVLRISTPYEFGVLQLGEVVNEVLGQHPGLEIELDVRVGTLDAPGPQYDLAFVATGDSLPDSPRIARRVYTVARGLYATPELVRRYGAPGKVADLAHWPCISMLGETRWLFRDGAGREHAIQPRGPLRTTNAALRLQAALAGRGATLLAAAFCRGELATGQLVPLLPAYTPNPLRIYAFLPARGLVPARTRVFMEAIERLLLPA